MRTKMITMTLLLMLATLGAFTPRAFADTADGDWTPTLKAQWWWKYVRPAATVM